MNTHRERLDRRLLLLAPPSPAASSPPLRDDDPFLPPACSIGVGGGVVDVRHELGSQGICCKLVSS